MLRFHVENMSCAGCANGVTRAIRAAIPSAEVTVDLSSRHVSVGGTNDAGTVDAALKRAGYKAQAANSVQR